MRFVLAPLAGFTDAPFRRLCFESGADMCFTEMVSAAGLVHGSSPTRHLLETMPGEGPLAVQLFGSNEADLAGASRVVGEFVRREGDGRAVELNLNAGCPMTKVVRTGAGARLVDDPGKIYRLLSAMAENTDLPVTLKTRLGPHPGDARIFEILDAAERAGAKGMVVHARYTSQMHGGHVHLDVLAEVVGRAHIPIVGNGSVVDARSADAMEETGVDAVLVSDVLDAAAVGGVYREMLAERYPGDHIPSADGFVSVKMHTHLFRYFSGMPGAAALRARLNKVRSLADVREAMARVGV